MSTAPLSPYVAHLVDRLASDLDFLQAESVLSAADVVLIKSKLPLGISHPPDILVSPASASLENFAPMAAALPAPSPVEHRATPPPPPRPVSAAGGRGMCRAVWDYPQQQGDDLGFRSGDMITILEEMNPDWWRGEIDGRTGVFPSNHVEKVSPPAPSPDQHYQRPVEVHGSQSGSTPYFAPAPAWGPGPTPQDQNNHQQASFQPNHAPSTPSYSPNPPAYGGSQKTDFFQPPAPHDPPKAEYYAAPPPPMQQPEPQPQQQQPQPAPAASDPPPVPKKKFFHRGQGGGNGLGGRMASSFAGGIGFGAGMAVAGDIVNAIL